MTTDVQPHARLLHLSALWRWTARLLRYGLDRLKVHQNLFPFLSALLIGVLCGLGGVAFHALVAFFQRLFWGAWEASQTAFVDQPWWRRLVMPAIGGLLVGPVVFLMAREAKGHGVPQVMAAVALRNGVMRVRVVLAKALSAALTLASGGSAGREGPIIQIGAGIGSAVGQLLRVEGRRLRLYAGCGAAAGTAAVFNAPIAGALFAVEIILGEFGVMEFSPIVIASVTATAIARSFRGNHSVFSPPAYELTSGYEFISYALLGVLCGVIAALFIRVLDRAETHWDDHHYIPEMLRPMTGGLIVGVIGLVLPYVFGDGYATVNMALFNKLPLLLLFALIIFKIVATAATLGSGGSGGVFAPSLFIGAMTGGMVGRVAEMIGGTAMGFPGGYALVGMGALAAGTMRAPLTAILIIFEITHSYSIILPLMTACIVSLTVSSKLCRESIYTVKLARQGVDVYRGRSLDLLRAHTVAESMHENPPTVSPATRAKDIIDRMTTGYEAQLYVADAGAFLGVISLGQLRPFLLHPTRLTEALIAEDLSSKDIPVCVPGESLSEAVLKFERSGYSELPVVSDVATRRLVGVLKHTDVLAHYSAEAIRSDSGPVISRTAPNKIPS